MLRPRRSTSHHQQRVEASDAANLPLLPSADEDTDDELSHLPPLTPLSQYISEGSDQAEDDHVETTGKASPSTDGRLVIADVDFSGDDYAFDVSPIPHPNLQPMDFVQMPNSPVNIRHRADSPTAPHAERKTMRVSNSPPTIVEERREDNVRPPNETPADETSESTLLHYLRRR